MLPHRPLGQTGLTAPILGLGVAGPLGAPVMGDRAVTALILEAYQGGARLFDTAAFYGRAEARLGRALKDIPRADCMLVSKVGTQREGGRLRKDFSPSAVRAALAASLRTLGVAEIDVLLLHGPAPSDLTDTLLRELSASKRAGVIRAFGVCGRGREIIAALDRGFGEVVQAPVFEGHEGQSWSAIAAARGAGFLAIESMRAASAGPSGRLSGADLWYLARRLRHGGPKSIGASPDMALRRALTQQGVTTVIVGCSRLAHLRANMAVAGDIG